MTSLGRWCSLGVLSLGVALCADFAVGVKAYEAGDYAGAVREWEPLAQAGNAAAQFNLGLLYYDGRGLPQNYSEAAKWFERSANQGYAKAQHNLGAMYGTAKGVKRDYGAAYMWLSLCAAGGEPSCPDQRDLVAQKLSPAKLERAQRRAREWRPRPQQAEER